jgi:MoxR-like ATPase
VRVLAEAATRDRSKAIEPVVTAQVVTGMAQLADAVHVDPALLGYVIHLAEATREHPALRLGLSMRGALAYVRCAKTWAASQGRSYVTPDDVKLLAHPILSHRILLEAEAQFAGTTVDEVIDEILASVAPPTGRAG